MDYIKWRQRKLGEMRWAAAVSRPDICARSARIAPRINALCGSDVNCVNGLVRVAKDWGHATALKYASPSHPWRALGRSDEVQRDLRKRGDRVHYGSTTLAGRPDAAYGGQLTEGKRRLGNVIGLASSTLKGSCRILPWTSKITKTKVKSSMGGEVCALRETADHMVASEDAMHGS